MARDLLHKTPTPKEMKATAKQIRQAIELEQRKKSVQFFLDHWNEWREFYLKLPPIGIKTSGQMTMIENCIAYANAHKLHLDVLIGCVHRAYVGRSRNPNFNIILTHGETIYDEQYEKHEAAVEKSSYEEAAMRRGYVGQA